MIKTFTSFAGRATITRLLTGVTASVMACSALAQQVPNTRIEALANKVATEGEVRVIIGLNVDVAPEGQLSNKAIADQRAKLKQAQNKLASTTLALGGSKVLAKFNTVPHMVASVDANALARLRASDQVATIEEDEAVPMALAQSTEQVGATEAWSQGYRGAGKTVAVLDTGVDKTHPMLAGKVVSEACYSTNYSNYVESVCPGKVSESTASGSGQACSYTSAGCSHGTHVGGIVAGNGGSADTQGVAPDAKLIAIQVFSWFPNSSAVMSYTSDQIKGLERVYELRNSYDIASVNMSLGGGRYYSQCDSGRSAFKAAVDNLRSVGIATIIASGNDGYTDSISAPACVSSAISVGAVCDTGPDASRCAQGLGGIASYSNIASFVDLLAPGSYIRSSVPGGGYQSWSGTSMAAPHVAGAWALLTEAHPGISVEDGLSALRSGSLSVNDTRPGGTETELPSLHLGFVQTVERKLQVNLGGLGAGMVTSTNGDILCGGDCEQAYTTSKTVTLNATPVSNSDFVGWAGACSGTGACVLDMDKSQTVTANFRLKDTETTHKPRWVQNRRPTRIEASSFRDHVRRLHTSMTVSNVSRQSSDFATRAKCSTTGACAK
ncbi:S8 family serine peptidase [Hydrogenophaga sp. 5NK40-0174]|uniref:S8 family peptidase n=1 Tax=Hydrogenophaga sp. 5NK40-0174 TaxID=3127649 RepID=UPI00310A5307